MRNAHDPLVPPSLFGSRDFTITNLATVLLYAALGVSFFLVVYQLQVAAGWSALANNAGLFGYHRATNANYTVTARTTDGTGAAGPARSTTTGRRSTWRR